MCLVKSIKHLHHQKNLCVYKMNTFALFTAEAWEKMISTYRI